MASAEEFLTRLFRDYPTDEGLTCEVRICPAAEGTTVERQWFGIAPKHLARAARMAGERREAGNVYVGVLPRAGRAGKAQDVSWAGWLWCDIDAHGASGQDCFNLFTRSGLPLPEMFVFSGSGGAHLYWRLTAPVRFVKPVDRDNFKTLLRRLARKIGGDENGAHADADCAEVARVLRIPGTRNHKWDPPRRVRMAVTDAAPMTHAWWDGELPVLPVLREHRPERTAWTGGRLKSEAGAPDWALRWADVPAPEGQRHNAIKWFAVRLTRGWDVCEDVVYALCRRKADVSPGPEITDNEVRGIVSWA